MKIPVAISALLFATSMALPALAATHPSTPVELVQYRPMDRAHADHPRTVRHHDGYSAHASAPAATESTHATTGHDAMPPGWHCMQRRGDDPSAFPNWQYCQ